MAVIRDVMPAFQLFQPTSVRDAQKLLEQHGSDAWVIAGGLDSFDWLKDRIKKPKALVDLSGIEELRGVRSTPEGIEIGAMTTLTEVVLDPVIKESTASLQRPLESWLRPRFVTKARSVAMFRRTPAAGTTERVGLAIAPVATSATPIRRWAAIANTQFCMPSVVSL